MDFTTTTKIARQGKKAFDHGCKIVLHNNQDIGMIWGKDFYEAIKDSGIIEQIREEMREATDPTTIQVLDAYEQGDKSKSIDLDDFKKKYDI